MIKGASGQTSGGREEGEQGRRRRSQSRLGSCVCERANVLESENSWGVGCNDSYSDDAVLGKRQGVELCLTTAGAEQAKGTVTAGWRSETGSIRNSGGGRHSWKQSRNESEHRGEKK